MATSLGKNQTVYRIIPAEINVGKMIAPLVFSQPFKMWNQPFSLFICIYFVGKEIYVKLNEMKKILGQIRGEKIRGRGVRTFFTALPPPKENLKRRPWGGRDVGDCVVGLESGLHCIRGFQ